jgi:small subunit ribosomal protein S9
MTDEEKQGEVNEPDEAKRSAAGGEPEGRDRIAAEDSVGAQETPTERQQEREQAIADEPVAESEQRIAEAAAPAEPGEPAGTEEAAEEVQETPRVKPEIPGMDLEVDIVREGEEGYREDEDVYGEAEGDTPEEELTQPIADAAIDLAAGARYTATGKRKTAVARVILKPGTGAYEINGRTLDVFFPRPALQRTIRTALETVGLEEKIDVVAAMHGGGVSAQAGALRHAISKALVDADPNLRSELKRRGFLTRDARVKERKKAGLKKARKRPQFSKR